MPPRAAANPLGSSAVAKRQAQISLALSPTGGDGAGLLRYTLVASNAGGTAAQLNLTASEPTGLLQISSQPTLFVGAGQSAQAPLEVRQLRTAAKGAKPLQLQVAAFGEDGGRLAFANVSVSPAVSSSSYRPLLMAVLGGFAVVAVIAIALVALNGGDDKKSPAAALSPTAADAASPDAAGAGEAASPAAGTAQPPVTSVKVLDRWDYVFRVDSNDCGFGAPAGDRYPVAFRFQPVPAGATVLKDGDRVRVVGVQDSDVPLGTFTFHPDKFEVSYPVSGAGGKRGNATLLSAFAADGSIQTASLVERYESPACAIAASQVK